jgi:hypothetical protein
MARFDLAFTSDADPYTESMYDQGLDIAGVRCPALANSAAKLWIEASVDWTPELGDSGATWEPVEDEVGNKVEIAVSDSIAVRRHIPPTGHLGLGRFRMKAVTGAGANANQTSGVLNMVLVKVKV